MRPSLLVFPLLGIWLASCSDDGTPTYDNYSPVDPDAQVVDAGPDATPEAGSDVQVDAPPPPELGMQTCTSPSLPAAPNRVDALRGLAVTPTRVYLATFEGVRAFVRQADGCPGAAADSFGNMGLLTGDVSALGSTGELLIVSGPAGTRVVNDTGSDQATCDAHGYENLSFDNTGVGFGSRGSQALTRFLVTAGNCAVASAAVPAPVFVALAGGPHHQSHEAVAALQREATAPPVVVRTDQVGEDVSGACSASYVVDVSLGTAVLDPACGVLRVLSLENAFERFRATFPSGEVLRAMAPIPNSQPEQVLVGAVTSPSQPPLLHVVDLQAP